LVPVEELEAGAWIPAELPGPMGGYIVVEGALAKNTTIIDSTTTQLFGPGALVQPFSDSGETLLPWKVMWYALSRTRLARLDEQVVGAAWRHPALASALLSRAAATAVEAGFMLAASNLSRLDARLLALLWHLADRFGRVTKDGTVLWLRLSHRLLAQMVGAQRPSVTTALRQLSERGALARREDGAWVLLGDPAQALERTLSVAPQRQRAHAAPRRGAARHMARPEDADPFHEPARSASLDAVEARLSAQLKRLREDHLKSAKRLSEIIERNR
jgi:CRP/FNR family transcriptional regulator, cyclic AMP receptor protein